MRRQPPDRKIRDRQYSLPSLVNAQAERNPDRVAILAPDRRPLTYGMLRDQIYAVVQDLNARGIGNKDRVAFVMPDGPETAVAVIAVASGAVAAPLNPDFRAAELALYLAALKPKALVVLQGHGETAASVAQSQGIAVLELIPRTGAVAGLFTLSGGRVSSPRKHRFGQPRDAALALFTSGRTARPKQIRLTHRNIATAAKNIVSAVRLTESDRCLSVMPLFHIHGLSALFASCAAGASVVCPSGFAVERFFEFLDSFHPTWYTAAPAIHRMILENVSRYREIASRSRLRFMRSASSPMPLREMWELERLFHAPFIEAYGMTEAAPQIASNRLPPHPRKPGSVGQAAGPRIAIMDESGSILPPGVPGEIVIRGDNVAKPLDTDASSARGAVVDAWFRTGDSGYLDEDGYLFVTGSLKEVINRGGEKVSPGEVDRVLKEHPAISEAAAFGIPHPVLGENVAAAVVLKPDTRSPGGKEFTADRREHLIREIRAFADTHLAHFKVPQQIVIVEDIPKGPTGKLERADLARRLHLTASNAAAEPQDLQSERLVSPTARRLQNIWADILGIGLPGIHDNFFLLGGHSLDASRVLARLREEFMVELPLRTFFKNPTIDELEEVIIRSTGGRRQERISRPAALPRDGNIPRRCEAGPLPLSFGQQRLWFLEQLEPGNPAYTMSASLRLSGELDTEVLEKSLDEIRRRHEILRTTFDLVGDQPVQVVSEAEPLKLRITDLSMLSLSKREAEARRFATEEACRPFDMARGPLFRSAIMRLGDKEHILLLTMHHIVSDGWSIRVLHRELAALYSAFLAGGEPPLPELPVQYGDFALWQREHLKGPVMEEQIAYWKKQLRDLPPLIEMPTDRPRPSLRTFRGEMLPMTVPRRVTESLKALSAKEETTLFMTLLAALQTLLFRYTKHADLPVGVPIANRPRPETEPLIGFFANTLVLRNDLSGDPRFRELLGRVRITAMDAYRNQDLPFEKVVEALQPERDPSRETLFQVMFAFQNLPNKETISPTPEDRTAGRTVAEAARFQLAPGLVADPFVVPGRAAKFDFTLYLAETGKGLDGAWTFNADLFEADTIERISRHYRTLLEGIVADPGRRLSELPLLDEKEMHRLTVEWNRTEASYVNSGCCHSMFEEQAARTPNALAVVCGKERLTYDELNCRANQLAWHLKELGVRPGQRVGIALPRSAEMAVALLAVLKAGGAFLPLDSEYPRERLSFLLRDAMASVLIAREDLFAHLAEMPAGPARLSDRKTSEPESPTERPPVLVCLDADRSVIDCRSRQNPERCTTDENLAYVIYTSGSTGHPKGVMITHANLRHYALAMRDALEITAEDRYLHTAAFSFSSSVRQFMVPLSCGAAAVVATHDHIRDPLVLFARIRRDRVSILDVVPSYLRSCIHTARLLGPDKAKDFFENGLRLVLSASETLSSDLASEWKSLFGSGALMINMFGMSETTGIVSMYRIRDARPDSTRCIPIGRPIADTQVYILDESGQPVPVGVCGEIYIGGNGVGRGYLHRTELTTESFVPDHFRSSAGARLFRTGDIGRFRADGTIEHIGRSDSQIKIRGIRIEPGEVEALLRRHPWVRESAVVVPEGVAGTGSGVTEDGGILPAGGGQRLVAFIVPERPVHPAGDFRAPQDTVQIPRHVILELRDSLKRSLPAYMIPSKIVALPELPLTPNGKQDRKALSRLAADAAFGMSDRRARELLGPYIEPRTHAEKTLADIWKQVLGLDRVGIEDNFFDLGGDSLLSIQVVTRANQAGLRIALKQLFQYQTIAELARVAANTEATVTERKKAARLASHDERMTREEPKPAVLVTVESLRAYGREALEKAGLSPEGAAIVAEVQLEASLRGQRTHHMDSIPRYARRIRAGITNPQPRIRIESETASSAKIDGDNGPGQWVGVVAMQTAIQKARQTGVGMVSARRSNHFGAAGHYAWLAAREGLIGICTTNGPVILAPTGGVTPTLGNNPLGVGIPSARHAPILLDIAMSVAPRGKIGVQLAEGKSLLPGWILDRLGRPSTDPADLAAGLGVPIGGHKGYGLALVLETMAGVLSGAGFCRDHSRERMYKDGMPPDFGHFFMVIDPELFMPSSEFMVRVDRLIEETKSAELADGARAVLIPGEKELLARERNLREGVPLLPSSYHALLRHGKAAGLGTTLEVIRTLRKTTDE